MRTDNLSFLVADSRVFVFFIPDSSAEEVNALENQTIVDQVENFERGRLRIEGWIGYNLHTVGFR